MRKVDIPPYMKLLMASQSGKKLIVFYRCDRSLTQSALDLNAINTEGEYFKDICQSYVSEQIIDQ